MRTWLTALLLVVGATSAEQGALLEQLKDGGAGERQAAVGRLAQIGDAGATEALIRALRDPDPVVRELAGAALWAIWSRSGDADIDARLQEGIGLMEAQRFAEAAAVFSDVIRRAPAFAEGWNKRATVYYLMGELDRSLADCEEVIRRNPGHFGALSGFGLIYLQKDDLSHAAEYFEKALTVNPNLGQIRRVLDEIRRVLQERHRQSV